MIMLLKSSLYQGSPGSKNSWNKTELVRTTPRPIQVQGLELNQDENLNQF